MSAPKKIWMADDCKAWAKKDAVFYIPYIRADIVAELAEVLEEIVGDAEGYVMRTNKDVSWLINARAALAKLEESHD